MRPVVLAVLPSDRCSYLPSTTAPTESRSRFSASAYVSPGSSIISPAITSFRPWMRTMPSDTLVSVPSLRVSAESLNCSMRLLISSLISEGLSVVAMMFFLLRTPPAAAPPFNSRESVGQRGFEFGEAALQRAIDHGFAGVDHRTAQHRRVDAAFELDVAVETPLQSFDQSHGFGVIQRNRAAHMDLQHVLGVAFHLFEECGDFRQFTQAPVVGQHAEETRERGIRELVLA